MQTYLGLLFVVHVLFIAYLLGKTKGSTRILALLGTALYFFSFYVICGVFFSRAPNWFAPEVTLENDYYGGQRKDRSRYFRDLPVPETEEEAPGEEDVERIKEEPKQIEPEEINPRPETLQPNPFR